MPQANDFINHPERFWNNLDKLPSGCWVWKGKTHDGYAHTRIGAPLRLTAAHRVAFFLTYGRWPDPCALHSCDNRPCCNPEHLFEGTRRDNNEDRDRKGRHVPLRGEQHGCHKLTAAEVQEIRASYQPSKGPKRNPFGQNALAKKYGVTQGAIWRALKGKTWKQAEAA